MLERKNAAQDSRWGVEMVDHRSFGDKRDQCYLRISGKIVSMWPTLNYHFRRNFRVDNSTTIKLQWSRSGGFHRTNKSNLIRLSTMLKSNNGWKDDAIGNPVSKLNTVG